MGGFLSGAGLLLGGLSALGGLFAGNKSTSQSTTTTTPNLTPQQQTLINQLAGGWQNIVGGAPAWNQAYTTGGLQNFLNNSINANQNANSALSSRGIDRTTAGAQGVANTGYQEGNQIASFLANAPIVEQQNLESGLTGEGSFEASLPVGTTSSSNTTSTGNAPISPVSGFLGGGAQGLAAALGQQQAATTLGNILKSLPTANNTASSSSGSSASSVPYGTSVSDPNGILSSPVGATPTAADWADSEF